VRGVEAVSGGHPAPAVETNLEDVSGPVGCVSATAERGCPDLQFTYWDIEIQTLCISRI
jgi:hypothetical protein